MSRNYADIKIKEPVTSINGKLSDAKNDRYLSDTRDRKWLSRWVAIVVSLWLLLVYLLLLQKSPLSDTVLIITLTTTTIKILGLPLVVLLNLFPKPEK